jgi:2-phospho-L-lactate guanylyltransferase
LVGVTFRIVLRAAQEASYRPYVVTTEPGKWDLEPGTALIGERPGGGLNAALEGALEQLQGESAILVLHADLPLARADSLRKLRDLAESQPEPAMAIVRSRDGGTNAMLLRPPGKFGLSYGQRSFSRHVSAAARAGVKVAALEDPLLSLDLDTPQDVEMLVSTAAGRQTPAGQLLLKWAPS